MFLPCHSHFFPRSIRIPKRPKCEIAPPGTQIDVRCMQPRFENGPYCSWSIRRDVGQVLHRGTFPCSSYDALLGRGQVPDLSGTSPYTSIDVLVYDNIFVYQRWINRLVNIMVTSRLTSQWEIILKALLTCL